MSERLSLEIGVPGLEVVRMNGHEGLSQLFSFELLCGVDGVVDATALLGRTASITFDDGFGVVRPVSGIIAEAFANSIDTDHTHLSIVVRPAAFKHTLGCDCRSFQKMSIVDIASQVIAVPMRLDLAGSYAVRDYTVQYREDDWTFLSRLLEEEGIYYWFDHHEGSKLVLSDSSQGAPTSPGGGPLEVAYQSGLTTAREVIMSLGSGTQVSSGKISLTSFDPANPSLDVSASVGDGPLEFYDAPGGATRFPAVIAAHAATRLEANRAASAWVSGKTSSVRTIPGMVIEAVNHPLASLDGAYLITAVRYEAAQRQRFVPSDEDVFLAHFDAIDKGTVFRAPLDTAPGKQAGLQSGIVIGAGGQEVHPSESGEVRVQQHWDRYGARDDKAGTWMRVAQRGSADSMLLPRMGWTVLAFNEEGDVDSPSLISRIHDGEHLPPYALPANKTRLVFKTATTPGGGSFNEVRFEDKLGAEEMFLEASRDMNVLVQRVKADRVQHDQTRDVGVDHSLTVGTRIAETVSGNQDMTIGADYSLTTGADRAVQVGGNETITVGGSRKLNVGAGKNYGTNLKRDLTVGAALIETSLGSISATGGMATTLVGGAKINASAGSINEDVGKVGVQLIGGAKIELSKMNRNVDARSIYMETVGGALINKSAGLYTDASDKTSTWKVGALMNGKAPSMHVEAPDKIELVCGGSVIRILPESIEIEANEFSLDDAEAMKLITKEVEHNP